MSFVSGEFFVLLTSLFIVYFLLGKLNSHFQWFAVLVASIIYYVSATKLLFVYLMTAVFISWVYGIAILQLEKKQKTALESLPQTENSKELKKNIRKKSEHTKQIYLFCSLLLLLGTLIVLKCCSGIFPAPDGRTSWLVMPLGISFFTFLSVGYCVDVFRGTVPAETNILKYALYVCYFPHIGQGPIDRYENLAPQLTDIHLFNSSEFLQGIERVLLGYFKKLVIANHLAMFIDPVFTEPGSYSGFVLVFAVFMYAFQLYADFSGYMDIACGVSQCLGIRISENFHTPYFSKTIAEYWRRWHITLGAWFRDYLYYPILRSALVSRISKRLRSAGYKKLAQNLSTSFGLLITWLLIGFWHGNSLNFVLYGFFHGSIIILSTFLSDFYGKCRVRLQIHEDNTAWKLIQTIRTFIIICISYILFRTDCLNSSLLVIQRITTAFYYDGWTTGLISEKLDLFYWVFMFLGVFIIILIDLIERKEAFFCWLNKQMLPIRWGVLYVFMLAVLFVVVFSNVKEAGAGNFIYYNF